MKWMLIAIVYTVTLENVRHEVHVEKQEFATEALCEAARTKFEEQLKTRVITVKTTCVQTAE
ncbi:hypothetical protein [Albidovulum sp.]|jgi:hypothetical protein|uniref:hypothetical protein n=1 Tax=Albidovulum sp. TaxID=1872424 RepID=UPI0030266832